MNPTSGNKHVLVLLVLASVCQAQGILPAGRGTSWNPGIPGGIPARTKTCATLAASSFGNGANNATAAIQAAIDACPEGQVVQLSAGLFRIAAGPIVIAKGISLRGKGPAATTLAAPDHTNQPIISLGHRWIPASGSVNLAASANQGARTVALASTAGLAVGQLVLVDETTDRALSQWSSDCDQNCKGWFSRTDRPLSQMMEIAAITGTTVTFTTPFHIGFDVAHAAQVTTFPDPATRNAGIEDLKVYNGEGGDGGGNIYLEFAQYSWVRNVESEHSSGASIHLYRSFRCVVRDSYFHATKDPNPGGAGYGIDISRASADNLVENNISFAFNKVILMRASGGGNVIGYNYMDAGYGAGYLSIPEVGLNASHMTTPHHELFEGNQSWELGTDSRWGNSIYITFFRNHASGLRNPGNLGLTDTTGRVVVNLSSGHYWYSFIGNVLGYAGMKPTPPSATFVYEDVGQDRRAIIPMWRFGAADANGTPDATGAAAQLLATTLRDGNFDYFTNTVKWDRPPQPIPDSLYLAAKPAFFGSCRWPWVDPVGATKTHVLPARTRFDGNPSACGPAAGLLNAPG